MPKNTATEIDDYLNAKFAAELVAERNAFEMRRVKAALEYNRLDSLVDTYFSRATCSSPWELLLPSVIPVVM